MTKIVEYFEKYPQKSALTFPELVTTTMIVCKPNASRVNSPLVGIWWVLTTSKIVRSKCLAWFNWVVILWMRLPTISPEMVKIQLIKLKIVAFKLFYIPNLINSRWKNQHKNMKITINSCNECQSQSSFRNKIYSKTIS